MAPFETIQKDGYTVELHYDEDAASPREDDNLGTLVLFGGGKYDVVNENEAYQTEDFDGWDAMIAHAKEKHGGIVLAIRAYDHSGIGVKAFDAGDLRGYPWDCPWDSMWIGMAYIPLAKIAEEYGDTSPESLKKAREILGIEVDCYSRWLNGEYTGYVVKDAEGNVVESCGGFDNAEHCKGEALDAVTCLVRRDHTPILPGLETVPA